MTPPTTDTALSPEGLSKVDQARQQWTKKLIDLSRRNNLLFFRDLKVGTPVIAGADPDVMRALLESGTTADDSSVPLSRPVRIEVRNRHREENQLVAHEAQKHVVAQAPEVLVALRPCWMVSPLSVSRLIPGDKTYFDVAIVDEASEVLREDAVMSLLRGLPCRSGPSCQGRSWPKVDDQSETEGARHRDA